MARSAWLKHVMATKKRMGGNTSLKAAMKAAKKTYKKQNKQYQRGGSKPSQLEGGLINTNEQDETQ